MNLYKINLWDLATPSFVSSVIPYVGTKNEIEAFVNNGNLYEDLSRWCKGEKTKGDDLFLPKKITKVKTKKFKEVGEQKFTHKNVWDCEYKIYYKNLTGRFVYYKFADKFYRAFYIDSVQGLSYIISGDEMRLYTDLPENIKNVYHVLNENGWGNKNISVIENLQSDKHYFSNKEHLTHIQKSILGYTDKVFETEEEMLKDYKKPEKFHFELFINDYFADG